MTEENTTIENEDLTEEELATQEALENEEELDENGNPIEDPQDDDPKDDDPKEDDETHPDFQGLGDKGKKKAQKRFNKISAEKYKALEDAAAERNKNRELQDRLDAIEKRLGSNETSTTTEVVATKPKRDDFEDEDDFIEAIAEFKAEEKVSKTLKAIEAKQTKKRLQKEQTEKSNSQLENFKSKTMECIDKHEDYLDTTANVPISMDSELGQEILDSKEHCGEIMYKLGKDPDLLNELSGLSGRELTKAFGRLEASLETKKKAPLKKKKEAPGPANTNRRTTKYTGTPKIQDLSPDEHYKLSCEGKL